MIDLASRRRLRGASPGQDSGNLLYWPEEKGDPCVHDTREPVIFAGRLDNMNADKDLRILSRLMSDRMDLSSRGASFRKFVSMSSRSICHMIAESCPSGWRMQMHHDAAQDASGPLRTAASISPWVSTLLANRRISQKTYLVVGQMFLMIVPCLVYLLTLLSFH